MTKGIRQYVEARFAKLLPKLQDMGGTAFRRKLLDDTVAQFDISMASASAAYNYAINKFREEQPKSVAGLGRTERGLNVVGGTAAKAMRQPAMAAASRASTPGHVTLVKAKDGEVVIEDIPRAYANVLISQRGGRGHPKLVIQQDLG